MKALYVVCTLMCSIFQGLRVTVLVGMTGTVIGSWLKVATVAEDRFWLTFLAQTIVGLCQIFILNIPARLAAVWFGPEQVSSACSIGVFGNQVGEWRMKRILFAFIAICCLLLKEIRGTLWYSVVTFLAY